MKAKIQQVSDEGWEDPDMGDVLHQQIINDMKAFEKRFPNVDLLVENFAEDPEGTIVKWRVILDGVERVFNEYHEVTHYLSIQ
jgi:hypothetical protein